jgi:hypothetical protein
MNIAYTVPAKNANAMIKYKETEIQGINLLLGGFANVEGFEGNETPL